MNGFWKRKLPAFLLAMAILVSLAPAALATDADDRPWQNDNEYHWKENEKDSSAKDEYGKHRFEDTIQVDTEATCHTTGVGHRVCEVCHKEIRVELPADPNLHVPATRYSSDSTKHWHACTNSGCPEHLDEADHRAASSSQYVSDKNSTTHWQICATCNAAFNNESHVDSNSDGVCDKCGRTVPGYKPPASNVTVTFINGGSTFSTQAVTSGGKPTNPGTPTKTAANCTYTFQGWTTVNPGTTAIYTGQSTVSATAAVTANTTYYAVYTASGANQDFSLSASTGTTVGPTILTQINSKFTALTGRNFSTVTFSSASSSAYGTLYANSGRTGLGSIEYAYSGTSYPVESLYFVPGSSSGYTVRYTAKDGSGSSITGTISINGTGSSVSGATVTYYVAPGDQVDFKTSDFNSAYRDMSGGTSSLRWVTFTSTNAYEDFEGLLYCGSRSLSSSRLNSNKFYYSNDRYGDYALADVNFQASKDARVGDILDLPFRAWYSDSVYYDGTLRIVVNRDESDDTITLRVAPGGAVLLDRTAFNTVYRTLSNNTGRTIRYIAFDAPSAYTSFSGKLYAGGHADFTRNDLAYNGIHFYYSSDSYGDYAIDDVTFRANSGAKDGESLSIPFRAYYSDSDYEEGYLKILIDKNGASADTAAYEVAPGGTVTLRPGDFNNVYRALSGNTSRTIKYVAFNASSAYSNFAGSLYTGKTALSRTDLTYNQNWFYYSSSSDGDYPLDSLTFKADTNARLGDVLTIPFQAYYTNKDYEEGTLKITISTAAAGTISYEVAPGGSVDFKADDFNNVYRTLSGNSSRNIRYVTFEAGSSYSSFDGSLYTGNTSLGRSDLTHRDATFYYSSKSNGDYALDSLTFKADSAAKEDASLSIPFRAYYSDSDYEEGTVKITVSAAAAGTIQYEAAPGGSVTFKIDDFNNAYRTMSGNSSRSIRYVTFSAPTAYTNFSGALCTGSTKLTRDQLSFTKLKFYYNSQSYGDYALDTLTFQAGVSSKEGATISIPFRAHYSENDYEAGTVKLTVTSGAKGDVSYTVSPGKTVNLSRKDFNDFFRKSYSSYDLNYVVFDQAGSADFAPADGTFYSGYGTSYSNSFSRTSLADVRFYYSKDDVRDGDYELDDLTFAAASSFTGKVTLHFTAYGTGSRSVEGTLVITPSSTVSSGYVGSVRYAVTSGTTVQINANDLARFYAASYPGDTLQYVTLTDVPTTGALYYNYYNASTYGSASREQLTAANRSVRSFYMSPASNTQYALTELTYIPSGSNYCVSIPFTAYGKNDRSINGAILISVTSQAVSEVYGVTPKNTSVDFPAASIYAAVAAATGSTLTSIQLLKLPDAKVGTIYVGSGTSTPANTTTAYTFSGGTQQIGQLRYAPVNNYTGPVEIPYVALNANGVAIASGVFSLGVLNANKKFGDITTSTWCYKYVTELADASVIDGYSDGNFKPNNTITYGAALKLIMLAAGYPEQAPTDKSSVFSGYLARARADGLITRTNVNLSASITRLQVAQLAAGALKLDINNLSSVKPFTDTADVYVQALNAAGIVEGYFNNGTSTFRPSNTLTRGQVSAIVWRMRNYRR